MTGEILFPVATLGGLGVLFGVGLACASKVFAVEVDPLVEKIEELVPGANCGACGYAGCAAFARALVEGSAEISDCTVGSEGAQHTIAQLLGQVLKKKAKIIARVFCEGSKNNAVDKFEYIGDLDCTTAMLVGKGSRACPRGCLGLGSCYEVCPFDAIVMGEDGLPIIDAGRCTSCGKCVEVCPKQIIRIVPESKGVHNLCSSNKKGKQVKDVCKVGCIACRLCFQICPVEAIDMEDNLAVIDYAKCIQCGLCANVCPTHSIGDLHQHPVAEIIAEKCISCGNCKRICPVEAASGEPKQIFEIDADKCIGCTLCVEKCPTDAIEMVEKGSPTEATV